MTGAALVLCCLAAALVAVAGRNASPVVSFVLSLAAGFAVLAALLVGTRS